MNQELIEKLENAGLKWNKFGGHCNLNLYPTLSELIEACGKEFSKLVAGTDGIFNYYCYGKESSVAYPGSTPEIAVANLYLELKKT